jgi:outer membrane protein assembly factor BamB
MCVASIWVLAAILSATSVFGLPEFTVEWEYDVSGVSERGFTWSQPTIADLNGDGAQEIIVGTEKGGRMIAVRHPGELLWVFPPMDEDPSRRLNKAHSAADIDDDGKVELIYTAGDPPGTLYCLNGDTGTLKWNWTSAEANFKYGGTIIRDVDQDGSLDIVASGADSKIYLWNNKGELAWEKFLPPGRSIDSTPNALDFDKDGEVEIVAFAREGRAEGENGRVYCLTPSGAEKWSWSTTKLDQLHNQPTFADINNDDEYEVIVGIWDFDEDSKGGLVILKFWGEEERRIHLPHRIGYDSMVADLDGDGKKEIYVGGRDQPALFYCFNPDLSQKWVYNFTAICNASSPLPMNGALGDITGDGMVDIVVQTRQNSTVFALDYMGQLAVTPYNIGAESTNGCVIGDIDNDGKSEVVAVAGTKMLALTLDQPYDPSKVIWPMSGGDPMHSGVLPIPELLIVALPMLAALLLRKR